MVRRRLFLLFSRNLFADHYQPRGNLVVPILRLMEIQSRLVPRMASACFVEHGVGRADRSSGWSRSRPESTASHNGHDCFAIDTKMVRRCLFLLLSKNLFADHYQSSGNLVAATLRLMEIRSRREHRLASTCFVERPVGLDVRSSAWSLSQPKYAASQNSRDFSATHKKMVGDHRAALLPKDSPADRPELSRHPLLVRSTGLDQAQLDRDRHASRGIPVPSGYCASPRQFCRTRCRKGGPKFPMVAKPTGIRSTAECHDRFAIDTKMVGDCRSALLPRNYFPTIIRPAAIWSHPFCDTWNIGRDGCLALFPRILSNVMLDRPSTVPDGSGADRNPQHRILVVTVLR